MVFIVNVRMGVVRHSLCMFVFVPFVREAFGGTGSKSTIAPLVKRVDVTKR